MPTPKKGPRLGGSPAHQKLILSNLAIQLIEHRSLTTTESKAKTLQPYVEKLVSKAKRGDMHARRTVARSSPVSTRAATDVMSLCNSRSVSMCGTRERMS